MDLNLETLKDEILAFLESSDFAVFRSHAGGLETLQLIAWDSERCPDYRAFLDVARKAGEKLIVFASREFAQDEIDEALEELEESDFTREEHRELETRLRGAERHIGETCALELAFDHSARLYVYEARPDWYDDFIDACEEISTVFPAETTIKVPETTGSAAVTTQKISRWMFPDSGNAVAIADLARTLRLPCVAARILWQRGFRDPESADSFLNPRLQDLHDPFLLRDMDRAVERIRAAIALRQPIEIHGDYDVDGVTSTVLLKKTLDMAGAIVGWHIPHRLNDGYGMRPEAIEEAAARGIALIISVDNGIRAESAIRRANELGVDVIVTDHHLPEADLPPAVAIVNPNRQDCGYPNRNLCGAGVAFKLAHAVLKSAGWSADRLLRVLESLLKLVAIATVADIVPLTGENRVIVKHGLNGLRDPRNPGLRALLNVAGFSERVPNATEVGFRIAPAINASGRMDSAAQAVRMFLTNDADEANRIARELFALNQERQAAERTIVDQIFDRCGAVPVTDADAALVLWGDGWHRGVVGIVASRVVEKFNRPAVVFGVENGIAQGSGRSIASFHLLEALESMRDLFTKFGGHAHAAGLTLPAAALDEFRERLRLWAVARLTPEDMHPVVEIDAVVDLNQIDDALWAALERIAPFGMDNPKPVFAARGVDLAGPPQIWKEKHIRLAARQSGRTLMMKGWRMSGLAAEFRDVKSIDVAFEIERDWFGGWGLTARACREC